MVFEYSPDTDMLYIKFAEEPSTESEEVAPGVTLDFDEDNRIIEVEVVDARKGSVVKASTRCPRPDGVGQVEDMYDVDVGSIP